MNIRANLWVKIFLLLGACVFSSQAELTWEATTIARVVHPLQVEDHIEFRFINDGEESVEILSLRSTCGCLSPFIRTNRISSGESGVLNVKFNLRDRSGPQRKGVAVRSSDVPKRPTILYIETNIAEAYKLSTKRLEWTLASKGDGQGNAVIARDYTKADGQGGAVAARDYRSEAKTCRLVNRLSEPIRLISVSSSSEKFIAELKTVREGFEYNVMVRPTDSATAGLAVITVQTECPPELEESRSYSFKATLRQ